MKQRRPKFHSMWKHFSTVNVSVPAVGAIIGGKVQQNIQIGTQNPKAGFENACAIRLSYALHHAGIVIPPGHSEWLTSSGADKKLYIFRVEHIERFLLATFGKPDKTVNMPTPNAFKGLKGIIIFKKQFGNATGHATLWDGRKCSDHCYFDGATKGEIWLLP
jgi:hypothetical protein